jgi:ABC-2 type transport system ATP-binding protein
MIPTIGARHASRVGLRIVRPDAAFARTMQEWGFAHEGGLSWDGAVTGPDRVRFFGVLSRYAGLIDNASVDDNLERDARHAKLHRCA